MIIVSEVDLTEAETKPGPNVVTEVLVYASPENARDTHDFAAEWDEATSRLQSFRLLREGHCFNTTIHHAAYDVGLFASKCKHELDEHGEVIARDDEWDGYGSQRDLVAAMVYNARAQSPQEMTSERWASIKTRFRISANQCLEQADEELQDL